MGVSPYVGGLGLMAALLTRRKTFVSYYHYADQYYRDVFELRFKHLFISKSVQPGDISTDVSTDYIKRLIQQDYISDASVIIVLVGAKTYGRKHVDWEIAAGLNRKVGGYSGLVGILLPDVPLLPNNQFSYDTLPARLADNARSGYAEIYAWDWLTAAEANVSKAIQTAFDARVGRADKIQNGRLQMARNLCD